MNPQGLSRTVTHMPKVLCQNLTCIYHIYGLHLVAFDACNFARAFSICHWSLSQAFYNDLKGKPKLNAARQLSRLAHQI